MPDPLQQQLIQRAIATGPPASILPRQATPYPATERAIATNRQDDPELVNGANIGVMGFNDPVAFSNVLGQTDRDNGEIRLNPALEMFAPEGSIGRTLAHELQHIRQLRAGKTPKSAADLVENGGLDAYFNAPTELDAERAGNVYSQRHPWTGADVKQSVALPAIPEPLIMEMLKKAGLK